jgi:hypothetical protein
MGFSKIPFRSVSRVRWDQKNARLRETQREVRYRTV